MWLYQAQWFAGRNRNASGKFSLMMDVTIDEFVRHLDDERGLAANTLAAYRSDLLQFEEFVRGSRYQGWDVPPKLVREFMSDLVHREYRQASQARKLAAVKALYKYLKLNNRVVNDPTTGLGGAPVAKRRPQVISTSEVERLLEEAADPSTPEEMRDRAMLETLYATGLRVSELVALDLEAVDAGFQRVTLGRATSRSRTVPLNERAGEALRVYIDDGRTKLLRQADEPAVFLNHRGKRLTRQGFWLIVKAYASRARIEKTITPHTLRHSFATHRLQGEGNVREIQELLGHASSSTTKVYAELAREAREGV